MNNQSSTVVSIMKNESRYVLEWIAYNINLGFDRIVIYDNGSTDGQLLMLQKLQDAGVVQLVEWWDELKMKLYGPDPQTSAYSHALANTSTDWICFIDADEFINLRADTKISSFLSRFDIDVSAIGINWRIFGSSRLVNASDELVISRFTHCSKSNYQGNFHIKSIGRVENCSGVGAHMFVISRGKYVSSSAIPIKIRDFGISDIVDHSVAQINHYVIKSRQEFLEKKQRGRVSVPANHPEKSGKMTDIFFSEHDRNEEVDYSILRCDIVLRERVEYLKALLR